MCIKVLTVSEWQSGHYNEEQRRCFATVMAPCLMCH